MASNRLTRDRRPYEHLFLPSDMSNNEVRAAWGIGDGQPLSPADYKAVRVSAPLYTGEQYVGGVHKVFKPVTDAMSYLMRKRDYVPVYGNWGGNRRNARGSKVWSTHAFLCAVDTHAPQNPMSRTFVTDFPVPLVEDWLGIKTVDGNSRVLKWGGGWRTADAMHCNAQVPPDALGRGVVCPDGTVFTTDGGSTPAIKEAKATGVYAIGSKAEHVFEIQRLLIQAGHLPAGSDDGAFGPATEAAVIAWQTELGITADGIWGPGTEKATRTRLADQGTPDKGTSMSEQEAAAAVEWAYRRALDRTPDNRGATVWADRLITGEYTVNQMVDILASIPEGRNVAARRAQERDTAISAAVTSDFVARFGRAPNAAELTLGVTEITTRLNALKYK